MSKLWHLLAALCMTTAMYVMVANAAEPPKADQPKADQPKIDEKDAKNKIEDVVNETDRLKQQYADTRKLLQRLRERLESSSKPEDKAKAQTIKDALDKVSDQNVDGKFNELIRILKTSDSFKDLDQLTKASSQNEALQNDLKMLIELLLKDDTGNAKREEIRRLQEMLDRLNEIIKKQERVSAKTDRPNNKGTDIAPEQKDTKGKTEKLLDPNAKPEAKKPGESKPNPTAKDGKPGEAKNDTDHPKGEGRPQEGKPSDDKGNKAEGKPSEGDAKENKPADGKNGDGKDNKDGKPSDSKGGDGKENKDGKPSDGKGGDSKNDPGKEAKPSDSKGGDSKPGEGKPSDSKGGDGKDNKDGKASDSKGGDGKDGKESKPSDGKGGDSKPGEGKPSDGKPADSKGGDGKPSEGKPSDGKGGDNKPNAKPGENKPNAGKPGDGKPGEGKPGQGKPGDAKPGEGKGGQGKPSEGKPGQDSKGKGEGKGDAKPGEGKSGMGGMPGEGKPSQGKGGESKGGMGGMGKGGPPSESKPSDSQSPPGGGKPSDKPPPESLPARKQIEEAIKKMEEAVKKLEKDQKEAAQPDQAEAERQLKEAKKKLEELLRQLREEEAERILAALQQRCEQMLAAQIKVRDETVKLDGVVKTNTDSKPTPADEKSGLDLADKENEIVRICEGAIKIVEAEGTAVAFTEVFKDVHTDMKTVETHLRKTDVGVVTVHIENDIIATLQDMIDALKKARQENKQQQGKPGDPKPSGPKPPDQLINEIAELKMIRAMQERVNNRTKVYARQYGGGEKDGPEALPAVQPGADKETKELHNRIETELKELGSRQQKIERITHDIATGKNKPN